jgi:hypothetical protein
MEYAESILRKYIYIYIYIYVYIPLMTPICFMVRILTHANPDLEPLYGKGSPAING